MPIHQPFTRLPVWLRRVLTLLAVVLLAALLTHWRQNASTYATGFWDTGSQPLVFGRMLQMENHQSAPGGFMGVYTQEWSDGQNRTWFRENTPVNAEDFQAYTHQSGLQGWAFGLLNRAFRLVQPSGETRETWLYTVNCILFYTAELLLALAVWRQAGPAAALVWVLAVVFAPWPQRGMKDLYWCLWTWLLPVLASLLLCRVTVRKGRTSGWCFGLVALAVLIRCMCGFEFVSTFLILCEIPLCCALMQSLCVDRNLPAARRWLGRTAGTGAAALGGMAAALGLWFWQEVQYFGGKQGAAFAVRPCDNYAAAAAGCGAGRGHPLRRTAGPPRAAGQTGPAGHGLGVESDCAGIVDGAFQGPRRHTYPSGADAVALCAGAGQLPGTGGHDKRNRIFAVQEETRPCGIPLNITKRSTTTKCW